MATEGFHVISNYGDNQRPYIYVLEDRKDAPEQFGQTPIFQIDADTAIALDDTRIVIRSDSKAAGLPITELLLAPFMLVRVEYAKIDEIRSTLTDEAHELAKPGFYHMIVNVGATGTLADIDNAAEKVGASTARADILTMRRLIDQAPDSKPGGWTGTGGAPKKRPEGTSRKHLTMYLTPEELAIVDQAFADLTQRERGERLVAILQSLAGADE